MLLKDKEIILASASPRRSFILKESGIQHRVVKIDFDESIPENFECNNASLYLAEYKSKQIKQIQSNQIYITADTVVVLDCEVIGKPKNYSEAFSILKKLSNKTHLVITGVCISSSEKNTSFKSISKVTFRELKDSEIEYYISNYQPFDKAGAYGIQEWIGLIGIKSIEGSYYNIMGLPIDLVYQELLNF